MDYLLTYLLWGLGIIVGLLLAVIVVFSVIVSLQPADFRISRSVNVNAPAAVVFRYVNNLHRFCDWSPFEKLDPQMKKTFSGPETGVGASYAWSGNDQAGEGKMTIVDSQPNELVKEKLEFSKPMTCQNDVEFALQPKGDQTVISWSMSGVNNFMGKAFFLLMNMESKLGATFDEGLSMLKSLAEADAKKPVA